MMKRSQQLLTQTLLSLILSFAFLAPSYAEPQNLGLLNQEIKKYHDSGLYQQELAQAIQEARDYIIEQAKTNKDKKLALVLDIDETSLSNYDKMVGRDFVGTKQQIYDEILAGDAPVIAPMLSLYQEAIKYGVNVFFVTGRQESQRYATHKNLVAAGYTKWSGLYLRPNQYEKQSIIPFKAQARKAISEKGYTIIASIGDQYSDIKGGFAQKGFKLPNPYYYLP